MFPPGPGVKEFKVSVMSEGLTVPIQFLLPCTDISKATAKWTEKDVWEKRVGGEDFQDLATLQRVAANS